MSIELLIYAAVVLGAGVYGFLCGFGAGYLIGRDSRTRTGLTLDEMAEQRRREILTAWQGEGEA